MARPRPVAVYYPGGGLGHCSTVKRAIARAVARLLDLPQTCAIVTINILYEGDHVADANKMNNLIEVRWSSRWLLLP